MLVATGRRLVRADFEGGEEGGLRGLWESASPTGASLAEMADAAWLLGPRGQGRAYLVTDHVVTQSLSIPVGKVVGLEGSGLGRGLAFEAEAVSGIGPFDAAQGWVACGSRDGLNWYWVSQLPRTEVERVSAALARMGVELEGVVHPGGSPSRLGPGVGGWQRLELWEERVVCVDGVAPQTPRIRMLDAQPANGWQAMAEEWFEAFHGERTVLAATTVLARNGPAVARVLEDEDVLRDWLQGWARELESGLGRVPVVRPMRVAARAAGLGKAGPWAVAAGVALACGLHGAWARVRAGSLRRELAEASRPAADLAEQRRRATELGAQLDEASRELKGLRDLRMQWKDTLDREHRRHATDRKSTRLNSSHSSVSRMPSSA